MMNYLDALDVLHHRLAPSSYVEIGCRQGVSLARAQCPAIAIDPDFEVCHALHAPTRIFKEASDAFFANRDLTSLIGGTFDLAFIDGMHKSEYALRDFFNLECHAGPNSMIVIDDVLPQDISWTTRERETMAWTGDIYKIIPLLRRTRPDLKIEIFDIEMKGMALISNLSPLNTSLKDNLQNHEAFLQSNASALGSAEEIREVLKPRPTSEFETYVVEFTELALTNLPATAPANAAEVTYIELLKRSLLNEIYLDDELRLLYLRDCLDENEVFDYAVYHDIRDEKRGAYQDLQARRKVGQFPERNIHRSGFSHTMVGRKRLNNLHDALDTVRLKNIPGDFIECGVWRGGCCILMAGYMSVYNMADRIVYAADSFEGLPVPTHEKDKGLDLSKEGFPELAISVEAVRENFEAYGLPKHNIRFLKGWFKDTLPSAPIEKIALLRLDGDLYESTMDAMTALYPKVSPGGIVIVDDYNALPVCRQAIIDYFCSHNIRVPHMEEIDWTGVWWQKGDAYGAE